MEKHLKIKKKNKIFFQKNLLSYLQKLKITDGDTLFIHSDISILKRFGNNLDLREMLEVLILSLSKILGKKGTLVFPAYYYEVQKKKYFDLNSSISKELGILPIYVNSLKNSYRSINPITSVVAIGFNAKKICNPRFSSSYGVNSPFDVLTKLKSKMMFFGTDLSVMTYVHFVEFLLAVPHRYNKYINLKIKDKNKKVSKKKITIYVRYNKLNVINDPQGNLKKFKNLKSLIIKKIGIKKSYILNFKDIFTYLEHNISKNPFYLLKEIPKFSIKNYPLI